MPLTAYAHLAPSTAKLLRRAALSSEATLLQAVRPAQHR